jgi:hypothetical protein
MHLDVLEMRSDCFNLHIPDCGAELDNSEEVSRGGPPTTGDAAEKGRRPVSFRELIIAPEDITEPAREPNVGCSATSRHPCAIRSKRREVRFVIRADRHRAMPIPVSPLTFLKRRHPLQFRDCRCESANGDDRADSPFPVPLSSHCRRFTA